MTPQEHVYGCFHAQYDQAGIFLRSDAENWLKAGVELSDEVLAISSILTVGSCSPQRAKIGEFDRFGAIKPSTIVSSIARWRPNAR
ncbi:DUF1349 domain-containing protein [Paraburkholderia fungorum]|uniref:DUF1349 domain-containing protein n=1 Tax=Paraburkholderia fungorum TaxID=134537 RepID=UPI0038BC4F09